MTEKTVKDSASSFLLCRLVTTIAAVLALLCATSAIISAQKPGSDVSAKIRELELGRFGAQQRKDNRALDAVLDNALVWVEPNGAQFTKADYLELLRTNDVTILEIAPASMNVHVFAGIAIVEGIYQEKGVKRGKAFALRARFIDTWIFKNSKWVCIAATATSTIS